MAENGEEVGWGTSIPNLFLLDIQEPLEKFLCCGGGGGYFSG